MKRSETIKTNRIKLLVSHLNKNATRLGLSDSRLQNMIRTAQQSEPGYTITVRERDRRGVPPFKCKHYNRMPHHLLPNVISYTNKPGRFDPISALFGVLRREDLGQREAINWTNLRANRFVNYKMNYMGILRDSGKNRRYWNEGLRLLKSPAFQLMAFNYVCPHWHSELTTSHVNGILGEVRQIVEEYRTEINLRRVYIPKANGKRRPLGVPTMSWRVFLHMLNVLIVWFRIGMDKNQHAYFPGRGVHTAWQSLLERIEEPNIFEFDLVSFFPNVNLLANEKILRDELGIPWETSEYIRRICQSITRLTGSDELSEDGDRKVLLTSEGNPNPNLPPGEQLILAEFIAHLSEVRREWVLTSTAFQELMPPGWKVYKEQGVPQGAAISCGLATVNLHYIWQRLGDTLLMYADDGLVFPKSFKAEPDLEDKERGIALNREKSGWVKKDGHWLRPLKFLGLEYVPGSGDEEAKLRAKTRNGASKEFSLNDQLMVYLLNEKDLMIWTVFDSRLSLKEDEEDEDGTMKLFTEDPPRAGLVTEISYDGKLRIKPRSAVRNELRTSSETYKLVERSVLSDIKVSEWVEEACQRFLEIENPLALLFQSRGLPELARMYTDKIIPEEDSKEVRCRKKSWLYRNLGELLFEYLEANFKSSEKLIDQFWDEGIQDHLTIGKLERAAFITYFKFNGGKEDYGRTMLRGSKGLLDTLNQEIKSLIRSFPLTIHNISSIATSYLLNNGLKIGPTVVSHCTIKKPKKYRTQTIEEQRVRLRQLKIRNEKEFYRMYKIWPRKLKIPDLRANPKLTCSTQVNSGREVALSGNAEFDKS